MARDFGRSSGGGFRGNEGSGESPRIGKTTRVSRQYPVQRKATGAPVVAEAGQVAENGFRGTPANLPHRQQIEASYGVDLGGVQAYTGPEATQACDALGAEAYTVGNSIAFGSASPSPFLAAHEAAHVVQQANGVRMSRGMGAPGDSYERQADTAAELAVLGQSAQSVLPAAGPISAMTGPVQAYYKDNGVRIADDGKMAVPEESMIGSKTAYATPSLITSASAALKAATSVIELQPGGLSWKANDKDGNNEQDLVDIVPVNTTDGSKDTSMNMWADCGRSAKTVSGMDGGSGQGNASPVARYNKNGKERKGKQGDWMDIQKVRMMMDLFSTKSSWWKIFSPKYKSKLDLSGLNAKLVVYNDTKAKWAAEPDKESGKALALQRKMAILAKELDDMSRAEYEKLDADAKDQFDKEAGINMYADPEIGEAFHVSTGGNDHPDKDPDAGTWNFHWAGVVMKTGGDTMTLENYSVSDYAVQNEDWVMQIYGVGKKGQSAHEEHRDVHKQHGDAPTTMVATRPS